MVCPALNPSAAHDAPARLIVLTAALFCAERIAFSMSGSQRSLNWLSVATE